MVSVEYEERMKRKTINGKVCSGLMVKGIDGFSLHKPALVSVAVKRDEGVYAVKRPGETKVYVDNIRNVRASMEEIFRHSKRAKDFVKEVEAIGKSSYEWASMN